MYILKTLNCFIDFLEEPRLTHLKNIINSEEKYLESLKVAVEVYGEELRYESRLLQSYMMWEKSSSCERRGSTNILFLH